MLRAMILELVLFIIGYILFIFLTLFIYKKSKNKNFACIVITLLLILYASIRYNVGSDYDTYYKQYNEILFYFDSIKKIIISNSQYGFSLLMYLTRNLIGGKYSIFTVVAFLIYPYTIYKIKKESSDFSESLFIYFVLQFHMISLNLLKQVISMTLFLKNKYYILNNKLVKCVLFSYLMTTFHFSSIVSIIILFISKKINPTKKKMFIILIISVILLFIYKPLILNFGYFDRYFVYVYNINKEYYIQTIGAIIYLIMNIIILFLLLGEKNNLIKIKQENKVILSALLLTIPFKVLAIDNFPIYRLSLYIDQLLIFIIPDYINLKKQKCNDSQKFKKGYLMYIFVMIILLCLEIVFIPHNNFYTYTTIFGRGD